MAQGAVMRARFHVEGQTSTLGPRWQIWDGEQHYARFRNIADQTDAHNLCDALNTRPVMDHSQRMARRMGAEFVARPEPTPSDGLARLIAKANWNAEHYAGALAEEWRSLADALSALHRIPDTRNDLVEAATIIGGLLDVGVQDGLVRRARAWLDAHPDEEAEAIRALSNPTKPIEDEGK